MEEITARPHQRARTLHDYARILVKRRWAALLTFSIIVASVVLFNFTATPIYRATVQILIERNAPRVLENQMAGPMYDEYKEEFYQTQYKLLESRALARKVVEKMRLKEYPPYADIFKSLPENADEVEKQRAEEALVGAVVGGVNVSPVRQSLLVNVSFSDPDPRFATRLVNTLAQCYIEQSLEFNFTAAQETARWLQSKLTEARQKLEDSEARLNRYKREQNIVTMEDKESITAQKLEQLNKELVSAQTRRMESETRYQEVNQGKPIPQVLNNPLIQALKGQEAKILAEQSELGRKFGPEHPRMLQLNNELGATRSKINAEMSQVVQSIKNEYTMAKAQEENLRKALDVQKVDTQDMGDRAIEYRVLLRDVETNRALYENMLKSLKTTTATESLPVTNIRVVYPATVPGSPATPRKMRNTMLGLVLGLTFGVCLAFGLEYLDTTLKTPEEVESYLEVPNLAIIPHLELEAGEEGAVAPQMVVALETQTVASESYRALRTSILFSTPGHPPQVLLITSALPMEGKTLTAVNLATAMAKAEHGVLLVDSDIRRPSLHKIFQVPAEPGLSNFLVGEVDELPVVGTSVPGLFFTPSGHTPPNPSELLGSARMEEFLARAQKEYGRVILDSPPLMSVTDGAILATLAEGVLLVVKAEAVPRKIAREARDYLAGVKAHLLGVVLNDVHVQRDGYYYDRYYRYHSYYTKPKEVEAPRPSGIHRLGGAVAWIKQRLGMENRRLS